MTTDIHDTLDERGKRYGAFTGHAEVTQALKSVIFDALRSRNKLLAADQQEALDMIVHKIGRIINGDENYDDSWHDIAGYATLVADRLASNSVTSITIERKESSDQHYDHYGESWIGSNRR